MNILEKSQKFAKEQHKGQLDKAGDDYYSAHIEVVAKKVENAGYPVEYIVSAYLHDIIEDTDATIEDITAQFGGAIANTISKLTKIDGEDYNKYIHRVQTNKIATIVKYYDMEHNSDLSRLAKIEQKDLDRKEKYLKNMKLLQGNLTITKIEFKDLIPFYQTNMYKQAEYSKLIWKRFNWFLAIEVGLISLYFSKNEAINELKLYFPFIELFIALLWFIMGYEDRKSIQKHKINGKKIEKIILNNFLSFSDHQIIKNPLLQGFSQTSLLWMIPLSMTFVWLYIIISIIIKT